MFYPKRSMAKFLILIFIMSLVSINAALAGEIFSSDAPLLISADNGGVWISDGAELIYFENESNDTRIVGNFDGISAMDTDPEEGTICLLINWENAQMISVVDREGRVFYEFGLPEDIYFSNLIRSGQTVFLTGNDGYAYKVYADGEYPPERLEYVGCGATDLEIYDDDLYVLYGSLGAVKIFDAWGAELARWDPDGAAAILPFPYADGRYPVVVWHDDGRDAQIIDAENGGEAISNVSFDAACARMCFNNSTIYTLSADLHAVSAEPLAGNDGADNTLYLINFLGDLNRGRGKQALDMFHKQFPGVNVVVRWIDDPRDLTTAIMSNDTGMDILCIQEQATTSSSIHFFKSGATLPLQNFECIENLPWESYAFTRDAFSTDGSLYALPDEIFAFPWAVNKVLMDEIGLSIPESNWTWQDFFDMAETVDRYNNENGTQWLLLSDTAFSIPSLFYQYGAENNDIWNGEADYLNDYFIKLAAQWTSAHERGLVEVDAGFCMEASENAVFTSCSGISSQNMFDAAWVMPPALEDGYAFPIGSYSLQLCANSTHPDMAAHFLACYMSEEALASSSVQFVPMLLNDIDKYPVIENNGFYEDEKLSAENCALWLDALANGKNLIYYYDLYRAQWTELYPALISGQMSPEEFAFACQQNADMVLGE